MSRNSRENNSEEDLRITLIDFSSRRQSLISGVVRVISEAVEHLKTSLILPKMLENPHTLIRVLTGTQFEPAIHLVTDFQRRREIILKDQRRPLMDHGMIRIIDYFQSNTEMYKLLQGYTHHMTDQDQKLLNAFEMLLETAKRHLDRDAKAQIIEERRLFKLYKESKSLKKSIDRFRIKIASYQTTLRWKLAAKAVYIEKIQRDMDENQLKVEQRIENETDKTQRITRNYKKISLEKQNQLEQELDRARTDYNKLTKEHKGFEKRNRDEKNKLLLQLEGVIKKYDTAMSEKITENLELEDKLKDVNLELSEFMIVYQKEEKIYHEIVVKREEREERERKERILRYMMNRAARKIQKYWRKWRKEHKVKAKGKRGKKRK
ncbi:dynein regulatory complex protein 10 isoform X3 [Drosophila innubila]|uniref:dynein regulatory complex protein 10 isoform X3 n=1 Tax=Drosophila innubila TaxID=198719 RepID=UPI00148BEF81|nr:dynein regulatory complex protein 10 isoform X3 [Drosophila innubila]